MTDIRKESLAAEAMRTKESESQYVPLNYDYGKNYKGKHLPNNGTQKPEPSENVTRRRS